MPQPSTTKVSLYDKDPIYMRFRAEFKRLFNPVVPSPPRPPTPPDAPTPTPAPQEPTPPPVRVVPAQQPRPTVSAVLPFLPPPSAAPVIVKMTPMNALKKICESLDIEWRCLADGKIQLKEGGKPAWVDLDKFEIVKV
jgi:hypothetical protein